MTVRQPTGFKPLKMRIKWALSDVTLCPKGIWWPLLVIRP